METDKIIKILEEAVSAPSGENSQPWKFILDKEILYIINKEEADRSIYNPDQKASYFAHGALIENILIISNEYKCNIDIDIFPKDEIKSCVAKIIFKKDTEKNIDTEKNELYPFIKLRHTNRKKFDDKKNSRHNKK